MTTAGPVLATRPFSATKLCFWAPVEWARVPSASSSPKESSATTSPAQSEVKMFQSQSLR